MEADGTNGELYRITVEDDPTWLHDAGYVSKVVAHWRDEGTQGELVYVPAEHLTLLRGHRHIRQIVHAEDGIYADRNGWLAVTHGKVLASGRHGMVPAEVVRSISEGTADDTPSGTSASAHYGGATSVLERDPVCGMKLPPGHEAANVTYDGRTFHFCSHECRDLFLKDPRTYGAGNPGRGQPVAS
jgi:YHS domain-containing protein